MLCRISPLALANVLTSAVVGILAAAHTMGGGGGGAGGLGKEGMGGEGGGKET